MSQSQQTRSATRVEPDSTGYEPSTDDVRSTGHELVAREERPKMTALALTVVMPAFNEAEILESSVKSVVEGLRARGERFEVIIVENGSTDDTAKIADALAASEPEVRAEHCVDADYGRALRTGLLSARGDAVVNFDTDFFDLGFLADAVARLFEPDGPVIVVGSKRGEGATDDRAAMRKLGTAVFSTMLRVGFGLHVSDTHGIKAMRREVVEPFARDCRSGQDLFDTELILRVERAGLRTAEIPVGVAELRPPRTSIAKRVPRTLLGLVKLRIVLYRDRHG
jgi:glycosyltransferase involved in cell wall biosynthesis